MKRFALAGLAVAALATAVQAGTLDDIKKRGAIRLGYSETSPPFSFKSTQGERSASRPFPCSRCTC